MNYDEVVVRVHFDNVNHVVENNIIKDNILLVSATATGRYSIRVQSFFEWKKRRD